MKRFSIIGILILTLAVMMTSCYSSRKYGCPGNPQATYKFRG